MGHGPNLRSAVLAALILGLALCPALPAEADKAALEKRVTALEEVLSALEDLATEYLFTQTELAMHLSAARRQEAEALAGYEVASRTLAMLLGKTDLGASERTLKRVRGLTAEMRSELQAWQQEVKQARRFQDEICENAALLEKSPPPPAGRISGWTDRAERLLESGKTGLRTKRKALTKAWDALSLAVADLAIQSGRLETFLSREDEFTAAYQGLMDLVVALKAAQKSLAAAKALRGKLDAMRRASPLPRDSLRRELKELRQLAASWGDLIARIDAASAKLEVSVLTRSLPQVGELDPRAGAILRQANEIDPGTVKANMQRAKAVVAGAGPALTEARAVLKEASGSQAGFGGLTKGRKCLAALRKAGEGDSGFSPDPVPGLVAELQTRLEQAERLEHLFTHRNQSNNQLYRRMKSMVNEAEALHRSWSEVPGLLAKRLGDVSTAPIIERLEILMAGLEREIQAFREKAGALADIAQRAGGQKQETCGNAERVGSSPPPTHAQIKTWTQQSRTRIDGLRGERTAAQRALRTQAGELDGHMQKVAGARDQLRGAKDGQTAWLKARANIHVQMSRALDLLKQAAGMGRKTDRERGELKKLKEAGLKELEDIQRIAADLAARLAGSSHEAELKAVAARAAALAGRYKNASIADRFGEPVVSHSTLTRYLDMVSDSVSKTELEIGQAVRVIKQADGVLDRAKGVRLEAAGYYTTAGAVLDQADKCAAVLARGPGSTGGGSGEEARRALASCDLAGAQAQINALPQGPVKEGLTRRLADKRTRRAEVKSLLARAGSSYSSCQYGEALRTLNTAGQKADCPGDLQQIADLKTRVQADKELEERLGTMVGQAEEKFDACRLKDSLDLLLKAQGLAKCPKHKKIIKRSITLVSKAQAAEPRLLALLDKAKANYQACKLTKALANLEAARPLAKCKKYKKKVDRMARKASRKNEHELTTLKMIKSARELMAEGKYADAKALFVKARSHTTCDKYEDSLADWIAKADARIREGGGGQDGQALCSDFTRQVRAKADEVARLLGRFRDLRQAGQPRSVTGPAACEVIMAGKALSDLKSKAAQAECRDAVRIKHPMGAGNKVPVLVCQEWREEQGQNQQQASCSRLVGLLRDQADEIRSRLQVYAGLREAHRPRSETGPAGCRVEEASKVFSDLKKQARDAGCRDAAQIKNPLGLSAVPGLECYVWKKSQGSGGDEPAKCRQWKRRVAEAEARFKKKKKFYFQLTRDLPRQATAEQFARHRKARCEMFLASREVRALLRSAKTNRCEVKADTWVGSNHLERDIRRLCGER